jgi:drug/metabolite transporter (DMT)-like permease
MFKRISLLLVLLSGVFWGSSPLFVSYMTKLGFDSLQSTSVRLILAAPLLFIFLAIFDRKLPKLTFKMIVCFAASGICSVLAMCISYYHSMQTTSAAVAAVLLYTAPIFVMIMSVIFFKEKITGKKIICLILAVCGCALTSGIIGGIKGSYIGIITGIISGISYSLYGVISTVALREGATPLACTSFSFLFAAIGSLFITNPVKIVQKTLAFENPLLIVLFMILFSLCTAVFAYILYTLGLSGLKPDVAAIAASSEPIVATLFGVFVLKQGLDIFQIIGILAVICAITILNIKTEKSVSKT